MAEGHVVRHNAERFHALLAGQPVVRAAWRSRSVPFPPERIVGSTVARVGFAGKNHLVELEGGGTFRIHLMMFGSTQAGPPDAPLRKPEPRVRFLLEVPGARVVVFNAPIVAWTPPGAPIPALEGLGPDALKEPFDAAECQRRLRAARHATVAEALLDPGVVAGVGNVFKSEILWAARVHPGRAPSSLRPAELRALAALAPRVMLEAYAALRDGAPVHQLHRVYRRGGKPCLRCGARLVGRAIGGRRTTWCPACQPAPAAAEPGTGHGAASKVRAEATRPRRAVRSGAGARPAAERAQRGGRR